MTRGLEESLARETSRHRPQHEPKRGIYQVNENTDIRASLARPHKRLDDMSTKREVNEANDVAFLLKPKDEALDFLSSLA